MRDMLWLIKETWPVWLAIVVIIAAFFGLVFWLMQATCDARWAGTFATDFNVLSGCRVFVNDIWVPEDRVREWSDG